MYTNKPSEYVNDQPFYHSIRETLDDKRDKWNNNADVMRENFFKYPHFPHSQTSPSNNYSFNTQSSYNRPVQNYFEKSATDGQVHFISKFFLPNVNAKDVEVNVRGNTLFVTGRIEILQHNSKHVNEFNQSIDLPKGVDEAKISATLLEDNILVIDCVMHPPNFNFGSQPRENVTVSVNKHDHGMYNPNSFSNHCVHPTIFDPVDQYRPRDFHLEIPLGGDYSPEEIQVRTMGQRIYINARHEERTHNRTAFREFSKEYDIPKNINPESIVSKLNNGILHIMIDNGS